MGAIGSSDLGAVRRNGDRGPTLLLHADAAAGSGPDSSNRDCIGFQQRRNRDGVHYGKRRAEVAAVRLEVPWIWIH